MRKSLTVLSGICLAASLGQAQAGDFSMEEAVPMAYLSIPIDGTTKNQQAVSYGFGLARGEYQRETGFNFLNTGKAHFVDFAFSGAKMNALKFNGVNTLQQTLVHNADGTTAAGTAVNWSIVVPAVVGGIVIFSASESGDNKAPPPVEEG